MSLSYSVLLRRSGSPRRPLVNVPEPASTRLVNVHTLNKPGTLLFPTGSFQYDHLISLDIDKEERDSALHDVANMVADLLKHEELCLALCFELESIVLKRDESGFSVDPAFNVISKTRLQKLSAAVPPASSSVAPN